MKVTSPVSLSACFLLCLAFAATGIAQTPPSSQTPELVESKELTAKVLKLYGESKYDEALPLAKRALELRETALGRNHPELVPLLLNLGEVYKAKQKGSEAHGCFERALQISEKAFGTDDKRLAGILDRLAFLAFGERDERKAESLFARSLAIKEKADGPESPEVIEQLLPSANFIVFAAITRKPVRSISESSASEKSSGKKKILSCSRRCKVIS